MMKQLRVLNKHNASRPLHVNTTGFPQGKPVFAVDQPSESVASTYREITISSADVPVVLSVWTCKPEATTVVFYPGTMTSPRNYELLLNLLVQQGFNVVGLHPLSHGRSPRIKKLFTFADILRNGQDAVRWTRQHFSGPVVLAGHSQGGILTLAHAAAPHRPSLAQQGGHSAESGLLASSHADTASSHVDAAFALCTLLPEHPRAIELTIFSPLARWREAILRGCTRLAELVPGLPIIILMYLSLPKILHGSKGAVRTGGIRAYYPLTFLASLFNTNLAHATQPGNITCPLTLICAANDALFTPDLMQTMFDLIAAPEKEHITLTGGGHMAPLVPHNAAEIAYHMARICHAKGFPLAAPFHP